MIRRPPRSTLFPTRRSSDLLLQLARRTAMGMGPHVRNARDDDRRDEFIAIDDDRRRRTEDVDLFNAEGMEADRKSTRLNSSHSQISYAVFCLKKKNKKERH